MKRVRFPRRVLGLLLLLVSNLPAARADAQTAVPFASIVVFGDSLSDTGNFAHVTNSDFGVRYPGPSFNYTDGRFTDGSDTNPAAKAHFGVWHEQLAKMFTGLTPATNSLDGGLNYAYGNATTGDGTSVAGSAGGAVSVTVENMGQQVTDYLSRPGQAVNSNALFILWGGADDLFADSTSTNVAGILTRMTALANRLAAAGAVHILIPNLPPLGSTPGFASQPAAAAQLNAAVATYNAQLAQALNTAQAALTSNGSHTQLHQLDVGALFADMIANPTTHGFTDVTDGAQAAPSAVNADTYLFWDGVHPTAGGHFQLATNAYGALTTTQGIAFTASPTSLTITRGSSGTVTITGTPAGGASGTFGFACTGLPADASCSFAPSSLTYTSANAAQTTTLTISTKVTSAMRHGPGLWPSGRGRALALLFMPLLGVAGAAVFGKRKRASGKRLILPAVLSLAALAGPGACGGSSGGTPKGSYAIGVTITGTAASALTIPVLVQ